MLTRRMQIQAIADHLAGVNKQRVIAAQKFAEPWRSCWLAMQDGKNLVDALAGYSEKERTEIINAILNAVPGKGSMTFQTLEELAAGMRPVRWLWRPWIPVGMLTLLGAVPGAGKSYVALDLANRIIGNGRWPDGTPIEDGGRPVIYVDAENVPQLLNERAVAWNMNRRLIYLMLPEPNTLIDFSNQEDRDRLVEMMHATQPALVVIDSLSSITSKGENNVDDVRSVLGFLSSVAGEFEVGMLLIHHLRKRQPLPLIDDLTADDFRGSGHIIAMARSVLGLNIVKTGPDADRNGPRKLDLVKTNLAMYPNPLGCEFVPLHPSGVFLKWGPPPQRYEEPTQGDQVATWLLSLLRESDEPVKPADVIEAGLELGYSESAIYRARKNLEGKIVNTAGRRSPDNMWALSEGQP